MEITLNHTIIHSKDRVETAKWYSEIFEFEFLKVWGPFAVVKVNSTLSLDFINKTEDFPSMHYAFKVSDSDFDIILGRLKKEDINYNSSPISIKNNTYDFMVNNNYGGRGVYFCDLNGHVLEILTVDYDLSIEP